MEIPKAAFEVETSLRKLGESVSGLPLLIYV
jgi:hypothetical protein